MCLSFHVNFCVCIMPMQMKCMYVGAETCCGYSVMSVYMHTIRYWIILFKNITAYMNKHNIPLEIVYIISSKWNMSPGYPSTMFRILLIALLSITCKYHAPLAVHELSHRGKFSTRHVNTVINALIQTAIGLRIARLGVYSPMLAVLWGFT